MPDVGTLVREARRSFWLLFGGIWLLVGVIMLVVGIGMAVEERRWSEAVPTTGMVLTKDIVRADADSSTEYHVTFRYRDDQGVVREGDRRVEVATWEALVERGPIDLYHLPGSDEPARLAAEPEPFGPIIFLAFGVVLGGIGGVLFGRAARGVLRAARLRATGSDAEARVTGVETTDVTMNRRPQYRVRYTYRDAAGEIHDGDSGYLDWEEASTFAEGDTVAIRYDARRPADSVWLGRSEPTDAVDVVDAVEADPPR